MFVSEVKITNYRGVNETQTVPLLPFSSVIGRNDSGKSIVLNALATFLDTKSYPISDSDFNDLQEEIVVECQFMDEDLRNKLENKIKSKVKKTDGLDYFLDDILFNETLTIRKKTGTSGKSFSETLVLVNDYDEEGFSFLYMKDDETISAIVKKYGIVIPVEGKGRNSKLEKIKYIQEYCKNQGVKKSVKALDDDFRIESLLPDVELFVSDYGLEADTKFKSNSVSEIQGFFEKETDGEESRLKTIERDIQLAMGKEALAIKGYMSEYTSKLQDVQISPVISWKDAIKSVDVSFQFEGDSKIIPMSHKGTGYRRLFMVARFRYLAEKNKGKDVIYLIEEPETFLHPSAQEDLLNSLENLSSENQVIVSTHSPVFAGHTNYRSIILCTKDIQSKYTYANEINKTEFIHKVVDELGIRPHFNLVDNFEKILFVESLNDADFYDALARAIHKKPLIGNENILVLPGGGSSLDSFVNIEYFERSKRNLFLIVDSDKQNSVQKQDEQKQSVVDFGTKERGCGYVLQKSCIENYYHPRTIERLYKLEPMSLNFFTPEENVKNTLNEYKKNHHVQFPSKNNMDVFQSMSESEWKEVVELELIDFLKEIVGD